MIAERTSNVVAIEDSQGSVNPKYVKDCSDHFTSGMPYSFRVVCRRVISLC